MKDQIQASNRFPYQAVLWDIDGTLADSEPVHLQSFVSVCEVLDLTLPDQFHDTLLGKTDEENYVWLVENCGLTLGYSEWIEKRFEAYFVRMEDVTSFQIALDLWGHLEALGILQATVSNSDRLIVQRNLARLRLDRPGFVSVARNDVRNGKPDPESYLRAAYLLDVDPLRCAVVEDSETGARAAHAAGMSVYVMPWFSSAGNVPTSNLEVLIGHVRSIDLK